MELSNSNGTGILTRTITYRLFVGNDKLIVLSDKGQSEEAFEDAPMSQKIVNSSCSVVDMRGEEPVLTSLDKLEDSVKQEALSIDFVKICLTKSDRIMYGANQSAF